MSRENVEVVRRVYEAVVRRDTDAVLALYDSEVEWDYTRGLFADVVGGIYRGHDGLRRFFRDWNEAWDIVEYDQEPLIDAGDYVVSVVRTRGRGRTSGLEINALSTAVWTVRRGKVVRVVWFPTREEALDAVGLSD